MIGRAPERGQAASPSTRGGAVLLEFDFARPSNPPSPASSARKQTSIVDAILRWLEQEL